MGEHTATLTSKGQITLPVRLRTMLKLQPGDQVAFVEDDKGNFKLLARRHKLADLRGIVKSDEPIRSEEIDSWIAEARASRAAKL